MLWIQGKSTAWTYLTELELNIHEEPASAAAPVTRLVGDEIEQKAEEIRKRALNFKPRSVYIQQEPASEKTGGYTGSYRLPGEEEIEFIDHRKKDNRVLNEVVMTSVIICLFAGGLYFGSSFLKSGREIISPAATEIAAEQPESPSITRPAVAAIEPKQEHSVAEDSSFLQNQTLVQAENPVKNYNIPARKQDTTPVIPQPAPAQALALNAKELQAEPPALKTGEVVPVKKETEPVVAKKSAAVNKEETPPKKQDTVVTDEEEKKGLGKAISRLFKKKKNKDEQKED